MKNKTDLPFQLQFVERIKKLMLNWAQKHDIKLQNIECVVPFVRTDKSLGVWLFYDTDATINFYENNGTTDAVKVKYLQLLTELNYPLDYLNEVSFFIDSHQNVEANFNSSIFNRLR